MHHAITCGTTIYPTVRAYNEYHCTLFMYVHQLKANISSVFWLTGCTLNKLCQTMPRGTCGTLTLHKEKQIRPQNADAENIKHYALVQHFWEMCFLAVLSRGGREDWCTVVLILIRNGSVLWRNKHIGTRISKLSARLPLLKIRFSTALW